MNALSHLSCLISLVLLSLKQTLPKRCQGGFHSSRNRIERTNGQVHIFILFFIFICSYQQCKVSKDYILSSHQFQMKDIFFPTFLTKVQGMNHSGPTWITLHSLIIVVRGGDILISLNTCPPHSVTTPVDDSRTVPQGKIGILDQKVGQVLDRQKQYIPIIDSKEESDRVE